MSEVSSSASASATSSASLDRVLSRAQRGEEIAFEELVAPLRRELHAHCYRMLGSADDADDALQDALVRAWRSFDRFEGRSSVRRWLHSVATHACLDAARGRGRRALPMDLGPASELVVVDSVPLTEVAWLGPWPTSDGHAALLPGDQVERRERVELAFVAALQHLPGNQRAALLLFEVLGYSAADVAEMMDTSIASVNSALQRARATLRSIAPSTLERPVPVEDRSLREVAAAYASSLERGDVNALVAMLTEDVTWSMPPLGHWYQGIEVVTSFARAIPLGSCGAWRHLLTSANDQPAAASYLRADGEDTYQAWAINVLTMRAGLVTAVTSFIGTEHFDSFGLPTVLP